jgi:prepilin-type processing-associated H-X9-DG protein
VILAAILFPVFARARENARRASCQSNLKQIGLGFAQYTQDYDERLPVSIAISGGYLTGLGWMSAVDPYVKSAQIFQCPSDPSIRGKGPRTDGVAWPISYAYNMNFANNRWANASQWLTGNPHVASLTAPPKTVMLFEVGSCYTVFPQEVSKAQSAATYVSCSGYGVRLVNESTGGSTHQSYAYHRTGNLGGRWADPNNPPFGGDGVGQPTFKDTSGAVVYGAHFDGSNYLFCDGHVKWLKPAAVSSGFNALLPSNAQGPGNASNYDEVAAGTSASGWAATFSTN